MQACDYCEMKNGDLTSLLCWRDRSRKSTMLHHHARPGTSPVVMNLCWFCAPLPEQRRKTEKKTKVAA